MSNQYKEGREAYRKRYYADHSLLERCRRKLYYAAHAAESIAASSIWALKHPEAMRASQRKWRKDHPAWRDLRRGSFRHLAGRWLTDAGYRWCAKCRTVKCAEEFHFRKGKRGSRCAICRNAYMTAWYKARTSAGG
jgi:hypothetical protein